MISEIPTELILQEVKAGLQESIEESMENMMVTMKKKLGDGVSKLLTSMTEAIDPNEDHGMAMTTVRKLGGLTLDVLGYFHAACQGGIEYLLQKVKIDKQGNNKLECIIKHDFADFQCYRSHLVAHIYFKKKIPLSLYLTYIISISH